MIKEKRDTLRFLGVTVYIYKEGGASQGRYNIRLAPSELMRSLKNVPKKGNMGEPDLDNASAGSAIFADRSSFWGTGICQCFFLCILLAGSYSVAFPA